MPRYIIQRDFEVGEDSMPDIGRKSRKLLEEQFLDVTWVHSHVTVDDTGQVRTFCVYESPDEETIRQHAAALGYHVVGGIFEIAGDVTPEDFPLTEAPA